MTDGKAAMQEGDRVTWNYAAPGGYGYVIPVAAIVRKIMRKRAVIEVARKARGEWARESKTVALDKLVPRQNPAAELGETN